MSRVKKGEFETKDEFGGRSGGLCMGVHAPWSQGKTLTLVFFAKRRNEIEGLPVVANFRITGLSDFRFLDDVEIIKELRGELLFIDEIRRYMDSYMSQGIKTRFVSNLTADLGKQSCDFYYDDQHYNAAPPRVKVNLTLVGMPEYDEDSGWVTLWLFHSLDDYLMFNPFFYFGFYGPDFWKYYDTEYKVEDYKFKFKVDRFAKLFDEWAVGNPWAIRDGIDLKTLNLWDQTEGIELSASERGALLTYLTRKLGFPERRARRGRPRKN